MTELSFTERKAAITTHRSDVDLLGIDPVCCADKRNSRIIFCGDCELNSFALHAGRELNVVYHLARCHRLGVEPNFTEAERKTVKKLEQLLKKYQKVGHYDGVMT